MLVLLQNIIIFSLYVPIILFIMLTHSSIVASCLKTQLFFYFSLLLLIFFFCSSVDYHIGNVLRCNFAFFFFLSLCFFYSFIPISIVLEVSLFQKISDNRIIIISRRRLLPNEGKRKEIILFNK